jgi:hypothetical protein
MAFDNENCNYEGFSCGEQPVVRSPSFHRIDPREHQNGLLGADGKRTRPIDPAVSDRIAFTISVSGDTDGVGKKLESTLKKHGVPHQKTDWKDHKDGKKSITFHDIPVAQLSNLEKVATEIIAPEHSTQRGVA